MAGYREWSDREWCQARWCLEAVAPFDVCSNEDWSFPLQVWTSGPIRQVWIPKPKRSNLVHQCNFLVCLDMRSNPAYGGYEIVPLGENMALETKDLWVFYRIKKETTPPVNMGGIFSTLMHTKSGEKCMLNWNYKKSFGKNPNFACLSWHEIKSRTWRIWDRASRREYGSGNQRFVIFLSNKKETTPPVNMGGIFSTLRHTKSGEKCMLN